MTKSSERFSTLITAVILLFSMLVSSCKDKPRVISFDETEVFNPGNSSGVFDENSTGVMGAEDDSLIDSEIHTVQVLELLPTEKYVYLKVKEGDETFWIATLKTEIEIGASYFYRGSVLQTNFESTEHNRVFEEVYFVSEIIPNEHGAAYLRGSNQQKESTISNSSEKASSNVEMEGSVRIAELLADPDKYGGKTIRISGTCTKINDQIMGRNWIHLKDGSADDYDFVITSGASVEVGQIVTLEGVVGLDRDFGAGYRYDIIVEGAELIEIHSFN